MAQKTSLDRQKAGEKLIHSSIGIGLRKIIHPILFKASGSKIKYKVTHDEKYSGKTAQFSKDRPIIFVCNHATCYDIPIALREIKQHTVLFAGKQPLEKLDEMFFNLNGTIYVDRKDKEDMKLSKKAMVETLEKKRNILVFPEGTWNTEDAQLMLEMKWGIIEVAQKANAIIVPLALNYDHDKRTCECRFGEPLDVRYVSYITSINDVRDSLATMRYEFFEKKGEFKREDIDVEAEKEKVRKRIEEYPKLDYEYEQSIIFHKQPSNEEVFAPIKRLAKK